MKSIRLLPSSQNSTSLTFVHTFTRFASLGVALLLGSSLSVANAQSQADDIDEGDENVEEIIVTGSYIKGTPADAISPVQTLSREKLVNSGVSDFAEAIRNLEIASGSDTAASDSSRFTSGSGSGLANVALRGLGPTSTLVMLNGKRMPYAGQKLNDGDRFVDINQIPINMIDRVEVLKDGGSALYGSDAIAGIVNFITRTDFEGFEASFKTQSVTQGSQTDTTFGAVWGWQNQAGTSSLVVGGEFFDRSQQLRSDRYDLYRNRYDRQDVGGGSTVISSVAYDAQQSADPRCEAEGFIVDNADGTASSYCYWNISDTAVAIPAVERSSLMVNFNQQIGNGELYLSTSSLSMTSGQAQPSHIGPLEPKFVFPTLLGNGVLQATAFPVITAATALGAAYAADPNDIAGITAAFDTLRDTRDAVLATTPLSWDANNVQLRLLLDQIIFPDGPSIFFRNLNNLKPDAADHINPQFSATDLASLGLYAGYTGIATDPSVLANGGPLPPAAVPQAIVDVTPGLNAPIPLPLDLIDFVLRVPGIEPTRTFDYTSEQETVRTQFGFRGEFGSSQIWNYDASWNSGSSTYQTTNLGLDKNRLELALYGLGGPNCTPNGAITPAEAGANPLLAGAVLAARGFLAGNDNRIDISSTDPGAVGLFEGTVLSLIGSTPGYPFLNLDNLVLAMTSTNQGQGDCHFFNPYLTRADGLKNPEELLEWIETELVYLNDTESSLDVLDVVLSTEFDSGIALAAGLQQRSEARSTQVNAQNVGSVNSFGQLVGGETVFALSENANFDSSRDITGIFAEVLLPLHDRINLQVAARFEDYGGNIGASFDPKAAVRWQFRDNMVLRGSIGTSFRGPSLAQLVEGSGYNLEFGILDPLIERSASTDPVAQANGTQCVRTGLCDPVTTSTTIAVKRGLPAEELDPEKATTLNLGFVLTPDNGPFSMSLDYYRIDFTDKIIDVPTQFYLDQELSLFLAARDAGKFVIVDPTLGNYLESCTPAESFSEGDSQACQVDPRAYSLGSSIVRRPDTTRSLQIIEGPVINTGSVLTSGIDFSFAYGFNLKNGSDMLLSGNLTQILEYKVSDFPVGLPDFDGAGFTNRSPTRRIARSIPDQKGSLNLQWNQDRHSVLGTMRYIGAYTDDAFRVIDGGELGPYTAFDVRYTYMLPVGSSNSLELSGGVIDLLDADLPALRRDLGTDVATFDTRGTRFYVSAYWRM